MNEVGQPLKIAFVVMPFGKKKTGAGDVLAPSEIDFDQLWQQGYRPALEAEGYLPVRADEQEGSLIVRDMVAQLMLADIVLSDISIPNANVYYEIGLRHGGSRKGCLLLAADWARPVFDLEQIRRVTYSLSREAVRNDNYSDVRAQIREALIHLDIAQNPVRELLDGKTLARGESSDLRETRDALRRFQTDLAACKHQISINIESARKSARDILANHNVSSLPAYCVRELFELVRDVLGWRAVVDFYSTLTGDIPRRPWFIEQTSWARSKLGETAKAIAQIEMLNQEFGRTSERCRLLGMFHKQEYQQLENLPKRKRALNTAIAHYEEGMLLDLNEYRCALHLLALYAERNDATDVGRAADIATHILRITERKRLLNRVDRWTTIARMMVAFHQQNERDASVLLEKASPETLANWEYAQCIELFEMLVSPVPTDKRGPFIRIIDDFKAYCSISQKAVVSSVSELMKSTGKNYEKFLKVRARRAMPKEVVASVVESGRETVNTARAGDYVVQNQTGAKELYIVNESTFAKRYELMTSQEEGWGMYKPVGKVRGIPVDRGVLSLFGQEDAFYISAPWGEAQVVAEGDMLVTTLPLPDKMEIYRIARKEFSETYREIVADA